MNSIRAIVANIFQVPIERMSFISYFQYLNEGGKISARSLLELSTVVCTLLEEQEKKNMEYEANFTEIQEILKKLVEKKVETVTVQLQTPLPEVFPTGSSRIQKLVNDEANINASKEFKCETCGKVAASTFGLQAHMRKHKK